MASILASVFQHAIATAILTMVAACCLLWLVQRERFAGTVLGFLKLVGLVVRAPFDFTRIVLNDLAGHGDPLGSGAQVDSRMMVRRAFMAGRAMVVVTGLGIVAGGVASGWDAMVPPRSAVEAYKAALREKAALDSTIGVTRDSLAILDAAWVRDSTAWIAAYTDTLRAIVGRNRAGREGILRDAAARQPAARRQFEDILGQLTQYSSGSVDQLRTWYQNRVNQLFESLRGLDAATRRDLGFTDRDPSLFESYYQMLSAERNAERLLRSWTTTDVRIAMQPRHSALSAVLADAVQRLEPLNGSVPQLRAERLWRPLRLATATARAVGAAFVLVWLGGLLTECLRVAMEVVTGAARYFHSRSLARRDQAAATEALHE